MHVPLDTPLTSGSSISKFVLPIELIMLKSSIERLILIFQTCFDGTGRHRQCNGYDTIVEFYNRLQHVTRRYKVMRYDKFKVLTELQNASAHDKNRSKVIVPTMREPNLYVTLADSGSAFPT